MQTIASRIEDLYSQIERISGLRFWSAGSATRETEDDLFQSACLSILEKSKKDPLFIDQKDGYVLQLANFTMKHCIQSDWREQKKLFARLRNTLGKLDDDDDAFEPLDSIVVPDSDPAVIIEQQEEMDEFIAALDGLSEENNQVITWLYLGYSESEIAEKMQISRPAVSKRKSAIRKKIVEYREAHNL